METKIEKRTYALVTLSLTLRFTVLLLGMFFLYHVSWGDISSFNLRTAIAGAIFYVIAVLIAVLLIIVPYLQAVWRDVFPDGDKKITYTFYAIFIPVLGQLYLFVLLFILALKRGFFALALLACVIALNAGMYFTVATTQMSILLNFVLTFVEIFMYLAISRTRLNMPLKIYAAIVGVMFAGMMIFSSVAVRHIDSEFARLRAECDSLGIPYDIETYNAYRYSESKPSGRWTALVDDEEAWNVFKTKEMDEYETGRATDVESLRSTIAGASELLRETDEIFSVPDVMYDIDLSVPLTSSISMPELVKIRELSRVYAVRILLALKDGNKAEVMRLWRVSGNIAESVGSGKLFLLGALVGTACDDIRIKTLPEILKSGLLTADELASLMDELSAREKFVSKSYTDSLYAEVCMVDVIPLMFRGKDGANLKYEEFLVANELPAFGDAGTFGYCFFMNDYLFILRSWLEYFKTVKSPAETFLEGSSVPAFSKDEAVVEEALKNRIFSGMLLPSIHGAMSRSVSHTAFLRMARNACAIEIYRMKNGSLPDSLDLLEGLSPDPFTGKNFNYLHGDLKKYDNAGVETGEAVGYRLYSPGRDFVDDGGKTTKKDDIFEVMSEKNAVK